MCKNAAACAPSGMARKCTWRWGGRSSLEDGNGEAQEPSTSFSSGTSERTRLEFLLV